MGRVERFKTVRQTRIKYLLSFALFFIILITGTLIVDYAVNGISHPEAKIELFGIQQTDSYRFEIKFANKKFYLNTRYVLRDYYKIKNKLSELID